MKLHLPVLLCRALITCMGLLASFSSASVADAESLPMSQSRDSYPNGRVTYVTSQASPVILAGYSQLAFSNIRSYQSGGAIYNKETSSICGNGDIIFRDNFSVSTESDDFIVTPYQFAGGKDFLIEWRWSIHSTGTAQSLSPSVGSVSVWGKLKYVGGTLESDSVFYNYSYDKNDNSGRLFLGNPYSEEYEGTPYQLLVSSIHNLSGSFDDENDGDSWQMGGIRNEDEHDWVEVVFNFDTGNCELSCGCGISCQPLHFDVYASSLDVANFGGAICNSGIFNLINNADIAFRGNSASLGGAIYNDNLNRDSAEFSISNNGSVIFSGNSASIGGAIYNGYYSTFSLSRNRTVRFCGNTCCSTDASSSSLYACSGGAIYNQGAFSLYDNEDVIFNENMGVAIYNKMRNALFSMTHNGDITFCGNLYGASIENVSECIFNLSFNRNVLFRENSNSESGGAIHNANHGSFTLQGNENVSFSDNSSVSCQYLFCTGGAISNGWYSVFTLTENGGVTFSNNCLSVSDCADSTIYSRGGGAISNESHSTYTLNSNRNVIFSSNIVSLSAIAAYREEKCYLGGGAVYNNLDGIFSLRDNEAVSFFNNGVLISNSCIYYNGEDNCYIGGGAIYNGENSSFTFSHNKEVDFIQNTVTIDNDEFGFGYGEVCGGAIHNSGQFTLSGNNNITFRGNQVQNDASVYNECSGTTSGGLAPTSIENGVGMECISPSFEGNHIELAPSPDSSVWFGSDFGESIFTGLYTYQKIAPNVAQLRIENIRPDDIELDSGAYWNICATLVFMSETLVTFTGTATLEGNGTDINGDPLGLTMKPPINVQSLNFSLAYELWNSISDSYTNVDKEVGVKGGAIYNSSVFTLSGNKDVLFEKNAEICNGTYRLRSIYSTGMLNLSASEGYHITFLDSVYATGSVNLNVEGTGDIVFSGANTETDLREVKGGFDASAEEIFLSRTSEFATKAYLYGGRLIVEDSAVLSGQGLVAFTGSDATVRLKNGVLDHTGYDLTFEKTTTLEAEGVNVISAASVEMMAGSGLSFVVGEENEHVAALTLIGTLTTDSLSLSIGGLDALTPGSYTYTLLSAADYDTTAWSSDKISVLTKGISFDDLKWKDGVLTLSYEKTITERTWSSSKGIWSVGCAMGGEQYQDGDKVVFLSGSSVTISGRVAPEELVVDTQAKVTFGSVKKLEGSGIAGNTSVTKSGAGVLTMNAGNTYTGGTTLNAGTLKATAVDSFGTGGITVNGGTLDLGSKAVANGIVLAGSATLKGDSKFTGAVSVNGKATLLAKTSYKGMTTIGEGSTLTLAPKATMAGSITLDGGTLNITAPKGMTLAKNMTMQFNGGSVNGLLTIGTGSTLVWLDGSFETSSPVLKGGTVDLGGEKTLTLTGSKAQVQFGDKALDLPGKGTVRTNDALTVNSGTVTVNSVGGYEGEMAVNGGTLKLSTGKVTTENDIVVNGNAAVVNGGTHYGDITVDGLLAKGTNIKLLDEYQKVALNGDGTMLGTISGKGIIDVNADINASAAKLTAATINLNGGTFTNTKGIKLAKGQTLTLAGASLDLGPKGALATVAGSTLVVDRNTTLTGSLTLGGGELVFNNTTLELDGTATLTLSKAMTVTGSGTIHYTTLKAAKNVDVVKLFGEGAELDKELCTLTFNGGAAAERMASAPLATAAEAPAQLDATPAIPVANPVADAMVQADWGILDAERAFMGAVNSRSQHAALLDKGRGAAWVSAFGASVRHGNQGSHHGSDGNIEGAAFGLEHAVSDTGTLGLAVGRSKNRLAATGVTHLRQETAHVALYGQKHLAHGFTADAAAAYGDTETKLGAASWSQKSAALTARLTHAQQLTDATAFRTFGGLAYEASDAGSIGAAHTGSVQNCRSELGAGITHTAGKAHLYAEAALTGDLIRHNPTADLDGFRTHGANPGRIGIRATVGGLYEFTDTWSGTASYGIETESRSTSHTLNVGVSKTF